MNANSRVLETALTSGQVAWKCGHETHLLPIQALPTILSARYTSLSCSPSLLILDLPDDLIDESLRADVSVSISESDDYRSAFIGYTQEHFHQLKDYLEARKGQILRRLSGTLTSAAADMFAVLLGVGDLLNDYFASCSPVVPPACFDDSFSDWLFQQLQYQSETSSFNTCLADHFVRVARAQIGDGTLMPLPLTASPADAPAVYYNDRFLHFTSEAFRCVCDKLCESRPVILRELGQAGMILGAPINAGTPMTRISLWDDQSRRHCVAVYKLDRSFFEQLGAPLIP